MQEGTPKRISARVWPLFQLDRFNLQGTCVLLYCSSRSLERPKMLRNAHSRYRERSTVFDCSFAGNQRTHTSRARLAIPPFILPHPPLPPRVGIKQSEVLPDTVRTPVESVIRHVISHLVRLPLLAFALATRF